MMTMRMVFLVSESQDMAAELLVSAGMKIIGPHGRFKCSEQLGFVRETLLRTMRFADIDQAFVLHSYIYKDDFSSGMAFLSHMNAPTNVFIIPFPLWIKSGLEDLHDVLVEAERLVFILAGVTDVNSVSVFTTADIYSFLRQNAELGLDYVRIAPDFFARERYYLMEIPVQRKMDQQTSMSMRVEWPLRREGQRSLERGFWP